MLLNATVKCGGYRQMGRSWWQLSLSDTTIEEVAALAAPYQLTEDDGETFVASFADYVKDGVDRGTEDGTVRLDLVRELPAESKNAIEAVEANLSALTMRVTTTEATAAEAQQTADDAKTTAGTTAASVNEYMDALLGLGATDETEATDAE